MFNFYKIKNYYKFFLSIFFLFPFFLISGPFYPDLFISTLALMTLIFFLKSSKSIFSNRLIIFWFFFYFYLIVNSILSFVPLISLETSIPYIRFILFCIILSFLLNKKPNIKKIIFFSFLSSYVILLLDSFFQIITGANIFGFPINPNNRVSSFFDQKLIMGSFVARTFPIILAITFIEKFKYKNLLQLSLILISGILIIFSSERLAFAYYLICVIFYFFLTFKDKNLLIKFIIIFFSLCLIFFARPESGNRLVLHTLKQLKETGGSSFSYRHKLHIMTAYNIFKDKPFIGGGLKSFRYLCDNNKYVPIQKIIEDNTILSPLDGYFIIIEKIDDATKLVHRYALVTTVPKYQISEKEKNLMISGSAKDFKIILNQNIFEIYKNNYEVVKKGDRLLSKYEFLNGCNTHPHNVHIQFLSELGLVGYSFLIIFLLFITKNIILIIYQKIKKNYISNNNCYSFFIQIGLFLSIFPLFTSGNFFNNWLSVIFYFNLSFLLAAKKFKIAQA
jgi:O-antigen ligase